MRCSHCGRRSRCFDPANYTSGDGAAARIFSVQFMVVGLIMIAAALDQPSVQVGFVWLGLAFLGVSGLAFYLGDRVVRYHQTVKRLKTVQSSDCTSHSRR